MTSALSEYVIKVEACSGNVKPWRATVHTVGTGLYVGKTGFCLTYSRALRAAEALALRHHSKRVA